MAKKSLGKSNGSMKIKGIASPFKSAIYKGKR